MYGAVTGTGLNLTTIREICIKRNFCLDAIVVSVHQLGLVKYACKFTTHVILLKHERSQ